MFFKNGMDKIVNAHLGNVNEKRPFLEQQKLLRRAKKHIHVINFMTLNKVQVHCHLHFILLFM